MADTMTSPSFSLTNPSATPTASLDCFVEFRKPSASLVIALTEWLRSSSGRVLGTSFSASTISLIRCSCWMEKFAAVDPSRWLISDCPLGLALNHGAIMMSVVQTFGCRSFELSLLTMHNLNVLCADDELAARRCHAGALFFTSKHEMTLTAISLTNWVSSSADVSTQTLSMQ